MQLSADLAITKTDAVSTATPGGSVTYTIVASNAGGDGLTGVTVTDTFPALLTCTWTCVGSGGGTCTASGSGTATTPSPGTARSPRVAVTITITATILPSAAGATVSNQGTIAFDAVGNSTNEKTVQTDDPGQWLGVPTPTFDATIQFYGLINETDYWKEGRTLEKLGLAKLNLDQFKRYLSEGE